MPNLSLQDQTTEFLLYTAPTGEVKVEVLLKEYIIKGFAMESFAESVNKFLAFNEYQILEGYTG